MNFFRELLIRRQQGAGRTRIGDVDAVSSRSAASAPNLRRLSMNGVLRGGLSEHCCAGALASFHRVLPCAEFYMTSTDFSRHPESVGRSVTATHCRRGCGGPWIGGSDGETTRKRAAPRCNRARGFATHLFCPKSRQRRFIRLAPSANRRGWRSLAGWKTEERHRADVTQSAPARLICLDRPLVVQIAADGCRWHGHESSLRFRCS